MQNDSLPFSSLWCRIHTAREKIFRSPSPPPPPPRPAARLVPSSAGNRSSLLRVLPRIYLTLAGERSSPSPSPSIPLGDNKCIKFENEAPFLKPVKADGVRKREAVSVSSKAPTARCS